jgi:DNA-binding GntR family transcriptional regulator
VNFAKPLLSWRCSTMRLYDEIVEKLRDMISEGELLPGRTFLKGLLCIRFGGRILSVARNQTPTNFYRALAGRIRHARYLANMSRARSARVVYEHEQILAPLGGSRPARLSLILKRHLANKLEAVRKSLLSEGAETVPDDRI